MPTTEKRPQRGHLRLWLVVLNLGFAATPAIAAASSPGEVALEVVGGCCAHMAGAMLQSAADGNNKKAKLSPKRPARGPAWVEPPLHFDIDALRTAFHDAMVGIDTACDNDSTAPEAAVAVTFEPSGYPTKVVLTPPLTDYAIGACVRSMFSQVRMPRFIGGTTTATMVLPLADLPSTLELVESDPTQMPLITRN